MDLREFIPFLEKEGELKRIKTEVDWDLEMSHIAKLNEERGGPALLFEKVKGYPTPVISSVCTPTSRLAMIMGMPRTTTLVELMREWVKRTANKIPPKWVGSGPCKENVMKGGLINLLKFPVPKVFPKDGGRFFGTTAYTVSKDPETGWLNIGVYRQQVLDEKTLGVQFIKGKHSDLMLQKYRALKKPMPVLVGIGGDPLFFILGAARLPAFESEYDFAGAMRGKAVEVVKGETVDLPIPAGAEIFLEGEVDAEKLMDEGRFRE